MRIIKLGQVILKEKKFECRNCRCEFIADEKDKKMSPRNEDYVVCPTCGQYIDW